MSSLKNYTRDQLRSLVSDPDDFLAKMNVPHTKALKPVLLDYFKDVEDAKSKSYDSYEPVYSSSNDSEISQQNKRPVHRISNDTVDLRTVLRNEPVDIQPPKLPKDFHPDPAKLERIRESIPEPESETPAAVLDDDERQDLDAEDEKNLRNIIGSADPPLQRYKVDENCEVKIAKYARLYPNLKPIVNSNDFASSREKLVYIESFLDSAGMNMNICNAIFQLTTVVERNEYVGRYVKLRGYTRALSNRRRELETMIEELKIKYSDEVGQYLSMPIEARLGLFFAQTALDIHMINSQEQH